MTHGAPVAPRARRPVAPREDLLRGVWKENPVLVQVLGMCPTLAVTNSVANSIAMGLATLFVLVGSCVLVSGIRRWVPDQVRIATFVLIIATFVTVADMTLEAVAPAIHKSLGAFVPLIVVNCIILARAEAFASRQSVGRSALDALGMGFGFILTLLLMGTIREILGSGTLLGRSLFGPSYEPWVIMVLPPGGFLTLGALLLVVGWWRQRKAGRAVPVNEPACAPTVGKVA
ncbi:MAG: electron transport complex subunit E [Gemmatimonadetes bacterium]|nr:electron transport complex subunit E [Gemmatimonadota bacterium]